MRQHTFVSGFSTIEIVIAFAVGVTFLSAAMLLIFSDSSMTRQHSLNQGESITLDVILESTALLSASGQFGDSIAKLKENWNSTTTPSTIIDISPCFKEIEHRTNWDTEQRGEHTMTFGGGLGSLAAAAKSGRGGCDPTPPTIWDNPDILASFNPTTLNNVYTGIAATAIDVRTVNNRRYAFLTSTHSNASTPDFWILDVTDPSSPTYISSLDISNGLVWGNGHQEGANDLVVIDSYAYLLRNYNTDQLQAIDISDPTNPFLVTPAISFVSVGVQTTGSDPQGEVITYYDSKLYIGLHNTQGPEFLVYDIQDSPAIPRFHGAISNGFNHSIYDIAIRDDYAYLAIKPGIGSRNTKELMVIDIRNPTPQNTTNGFNASETTTDTEGARSLYILGNKLYLGREKVNNPKYDLYIFDISTPAVPTLLGSKNTGQQSGSLFSTLYVSRNLLFAGSTKDGELQTWNIHSPNTITHHGCAALNLSGGIIDMTYQANNIYAATSGDTFLHILYDEPNDTTCN